MALRHSRVVESEKNFACALEIRERILASDDPRLLETRIGVTYTLLNACKLTEAREMLDLVQAHAGADPRSVELRRDAEFLRVALEEKAGDWRSAQYHLRRIIDDCIKAPIWTCVVTYSALASHARIGHAPGAASLQLPWPHDAAEKATPAQRQFAVLQLYELYRVTAQSENASRVARDYQIVTRSSKTPVPLGGMTPPGPFCRGPHTQHETQMFRAAWDEASETIDNCIESLPVLDSQRPPTMRVSFLSRPDGTIAAAEAQGIGVPPDVLECAVEAAEAMRIPARDGGAWVNDLLFRPDSMRRGKRF